jgi:ribonuclease P protein subunit POP4
MLAPENLARQELIGQKVTVDDSTNPCLTGLSGKVVDETRNTFLLETERGTKRIPKSNTSLIFTLPDGRRVRVAGSILISQPENRTNKRMHKTRWKL